METFFFIFAVLGLELRAYILSHSTSPFYVKYCWDRVSRTICPSWLQTAILLISASWAAGIINVSHQCPATWRFYILATIGNTEKQVTKICNLVEKTGIWSVPTIQYNIHCHRDRHIQKYYFDDPDCFCLILSTIFLIPIQKISLDMLTSDLTPWTIRSYLNSFIKKIREKWPKHCIMHIWIK
jgi:hypothetical protein